MVTTLRTCSFRILACVALILSLLTFNAAVSPGGARVEVATAAALSLDTATRARVNATYGRLPLYFEANQGQTDPQVKFLARGAGQTLFLTSTEAVLVLTKAAPQARGLQRTLTGPPAARTGTQTVLRMTFVGASSQPLIVGQRELAGKVNYFLGNDPAKWRTNVPTYAEVRYEGLYPGVDLVYYGNDRQLEYDLVVAPGADPSQIALNFKGADRLEVDAQGDLVLHTAVGAIHQRRPMVYEELKDGRREIAGGYVLKGAESVGFQVGAYDTSRSLVIDPVLLYSTYLGGTLYEDGRGIAVDTDGNAYLTGTTTSTNFPTTPGAFQTVRGGGDYNDDAFVAKLNPSGSGLVYSTYLGGQEQDLGYDIAVDAAGNAYVAGYSTSYDFPTTLGAFQIVGGSFVAKLNPTGSGLVYSTRLSGAGTIDQPQISIAIDADGNAYLTGLGRLILTTPRAFQPVMNGSCDAFVMKLHWTGSILVYSTYLGGSGGGDNPQNCNERGLDIAVDSAGNAYVVGTTNSTDFPTTPGAFQTDTGLSFLAKLNPSGSELVYSTRLPVAGWGIAVDVLGNAYLTGGAGADLPTTPGAFQTAPGGGGEVFVMKLNPTGSELVYSTYLGGAGNEMGSDIAVDAAGNAYVTGNTDSMDFPTTPGAFQAERKGIGDTFVTELNPSGSGLVYSTYFGGTGMEWGIGIAVGEDSAYVIGLTGSSDFPTTAGAFNTVFNGYADAFIVKFAGFAQQAPPSEPSPPLLPLPPLPPLPSLPPLPPPLGG